MAHEDAAAKASHDVANAPAIAGYAVGELLGEGGFGAVFRARHAVIDREVAIKVLHARYSNDAEAMARFVAEARSVNQIAHPGIVEIFDVGALGDGRPFLIMELLRGRTLRAVVDERGKLPLDEALPILRGIAEAIAAAHAAGIAHRDLKPDNVFVLDDGRVKLIDFGLAKLTRADSVDLTQSGSVFGSPLYMSPEQCRGRGIGLPTDAYSFGVLAYRVLTGVPPFSGDPLELALHHLNDLPEPPSKRTELPALVADRVDRTLLAALAKDPADRPTSLVAIVDALAGDVSPPRLPRKSRRAWWLAGGSLAAIAIAAVVGARSCTSADECVLGEERLAGVWDAPTRDAIGARFAAVQRADVPGVWHLISTGLDAYAARWATQWDAACHSDDRKADALLYAQRLTCLENALLAFRGLQKSLATADVGKLAEGITSTFISANVPELEDCANVTMLREQRRAPPADKQAEIAALGEEWRLARAEAREGLNGGKREGLDAGLARMANVAARLEAIGASGANESNWYASYLVNEAENDPKRIEKAKAAVTEAIRRSEAAHDDNMLADSLRERARMDLLEHAPTTEIEATIARGEAAAKRAGKTHHQALEFARVDLLIRERHLEQAVTTMLAAIASNPEAVGAPNLRAQLVTMLSHLGRHEEAIAAARELLANESHMLGDTHVQVAGAHLDLARALRRGNQLDAALAELGRADAIYERIGNVAIGKRREVWMRQLEIAHALGRTDPAAQAESALLRSGETLTGILISALSTGRFALASSVMDRLERTPGSLSAAAIADAKATVAFVTGDLVEMKRQAVLVTPAIPDPTSTAWIFGFEMSPWLVAIAAATTGERAAAEAQLARLAPARESTNHDFAMGAVISDGFVLAKLGRWREARERFEKARAGIPWAPNGDGAELDAWLGLARVETGEPALAIEPLERSLDVLFECCDGLHYFAPMAELALARALWDTGGDKARARTLAEHARDHAAQLGPHRDAEKQAAIRWLAEHPSR